ncbi:MAG: pseudaminic acid biosynthesis-associated methylase [Gammaproteobacteria bacterium]|nr:pseudaminic acid biosynthesis-associated methylase [Gammaproteobacteria bacterium]MDH5801224.1 pseudaminic acid biosynthesis-associated methylase [Gammaproteobacteria bacterium]
MKTGQEKFWQGEFGKEYISRNIGAKLAAANLSFFSEVIRRTGNLGNILEMGCNVGMNLRALRSLLPSCKLTGIEINEEAAKILREWGEAEVVVDSVLDVTLDTTYELTFTKGLLIHINPDYVNEVYKRLYEYSTKYILIAEYYNPTPVALEYRGHKDRLYKRDFANEIMTLYSDLTLKDYGFLYRNDPVYPQDDITWFLMEKGK